MNAVKFIEGSDNLIEGPGIPFGGPFGGKDLDGEKFTTKTDFAFDWFAPDARPLLYHHGFDKDAGASVVGRVKSYEVKADIGVWTRAQLDASSEYFSAIKELIAAGKLFFSSGAMSHLVDVDRKSGEIKRWPWVELSLTPTPANLFATVDLATAKAHFKSAGLDLPDDLAPEDDATKMSSADMPEQADRQATPVEKKPASMTMMRRMAKEMDMEMSDEEMQAMLDANPDMDEDGLRKRLQKRKGKAVTPTDLLESLDDLDLATVPPAVLGEAVHTLAAALGESTKGLHERRIKEGRMLSTPNRKRLQTCVESMGTAMKDLMDLLDATEPQPAKAASVERLLALWNLYL